MGRKATPACRNAIRITDHVGVLVSQNAYPVSLRRAGTGPPGIAGLPKQEKLCKARGPLMARAFSFERFTAKDEKK